MAVVDYCVFEYLYRDSGNYKAYGELLLEGSLGEADIAKLRSALESGEYFIAEQLEIPTLYESLWAECKSSPSEEYDHVWHEFSGVRAATAEDLSTLKPWGSAVTLLAVVLKIAVWNLSLSQNWDFDDCDH